MKTLTPGHCYWLADFDDPQGIGQIIQFFEEEPIAPGSTTLRTVNDGTTNEEVLEMLIDRIGMLNAKVPCRENAIVLTHLETAKLWLENRTADRKKRNVEGTAQK